MKVMIEVNIHVAKTKAYYTRDRSSTNHAMHIMEVEALFEKERAVGAEEQNTRLFWDDG